MTNDENIPPRVRAAEERRRFRELLDRSSLGTPGAKALTKYGRWFLGEPGAKPPTPEEIALADAELAAMEPRRRRRPSGSA